MHPSYFRLVRAFPLLSVGNAARLEEVTQVAATLSGRELDSGEREYLAATNDLIAAYHRKKAARDRQAAIRQHFRV